MSAMSSTSRRAIATAARSIRPLPASRAYIVPSHVARKAKKDLPAAPYLMEKPPQFPVPNDPFTDKPVVQHKEYSETTIKIVRGISRLLGYNSRASTAIRESGRIMHGIVRCVERDAEFWYGECGLPRTYQVFFQIHLLYVLIMLTRLRALPGSYPKTAPAPAAEGDAVSSSSSSAPATAPATPAPVDDTPLLAKPFYTSYPTELLTHFFDMAEGEMRKVLGRGERERVVRKYMQEMGEQWRGAGIGLDYAMGLAASPDPADRAAADIELASWLWRNLFASRGLEPAGGPPAPATGQEDGVAIEAFGQEAVDEKMAEQLEAVVRFVRREMVRLDALSDKDVLDGEVGVWGSPGYEAL